MQFMLFTRYDNIILWIESLPISKVKHPLKDSVDNSSLSHQSKLFKYITMLIFDIMKPQMLASVYVDINASP